MTKRTKHIKSLQPSAHANYGVTRQFVNSLMKGGDKTNAFKMLLDSIKICKSKMFERNIKEPDSSLKGALGLFPLQSYSPSSSIRSATGHRALYNLSATGHKQQSDQICIDTIYNVEPIIETRKVRVRGSIYQVPLISHVRRRRRVAMHWILTAAQSKKRLSRRLFFTCLGQELFDSLNKSSSSILRRDQMYKLAAHSRAYARYRWW